MRDFRQFEGDVRRFLMAVLFAMPLSSAADVARLNTYSRAYVGKILPALEAEKLVFREKAGHVRGLVWRWAPTGPGVEFVISECGVTPVGPNLEQRLNFLRLRMDLVETAYRVVPGLLQDFADTIKYQRILIDPREGFWSRDEPGPVPVSEKYRLVGFQWCLAPQFDAVAEYAAPGLDRLIEGGGRGPFRLQIPVVRCGVHGKPPMEPDTGFPGFTGEAYDAVTMGFQGINYQPHTMGPPYLFRHRFYMRPAAVITITDHNDALGLQFAEMHYGMDDLRQLYPVIPFDDVGTPLGNPLVQTGYGTISDPADRGPIAVPNITTGDSGPSAAAQQQWNNRIFAAVNGAMESRVFGVVSSHRAIAYADIVGVCGKTDRANVRESLQKLVDAGLVASRNDIYFLTGAGWQLCAIREGVDIEAVSAKFDGMFNQDGMVSRRWVNRNAVIARLSIALQAEDIQTVEGWRPAPHRMWDLRMGPDREVPNPDAWVLLHQDRWAALEYFEASPRERTPEQRLGQYAGDTPGEFVGLLAVCETAAAERAVANAGSELSMLTTTRAEMLRGPHYGADTIWRYRGYPNDVDTLRRGEFETEPLPSPVGPTRRRWFQALRLPGA